MDNIFSYNSLTGIWGIGHILESILSNGHVPVLLKQILYDLFTYYLALFKPFFFLIEIILIRILVRSKKLDLLALSFVVFCLFLALTPGFGVQYLSWLSYFAIIMYPLLGGIYVALGGVFLYRVYLFWGRGQAPYYANSLVAGQWGGFDLVLDIILWFTIVAMLVTPKPQNPKTPKPLTFSFYIIYKHIKYITILRYYVILLYIENCNGMIWLNREPFIAIITKE